MPSRVGNHRDSSLRQKTHVMAVKASSFSDGRSQSKTERKTLVREVFKEAGERGESMSKVPRKKVPSRLRFLEIGKAHMTVIWGDTSGF